MQILSEKMPWPDVPTAWEKLKRRETPQRQEFSMIADDVWTFIKKCWSPKMPGVRPSAQEVLLFVSDTMERESMLALHSSGTLTRTPTHLPIDLNGDIEDPTPSIRVGGLDSQTWWVPNVEIARHAVQLL